MLTKAERTKQFILEKAAPLYNEKGISGVSIDDVLDATQLTKGCIYGHFAGKDDLSEQVIAYALGNVTQKIMMEVSRHKTAKGKVYAFIDFYKNPLDTIIPGGCPIFNTAVEADDNFPAIKQKVAATFRAGQESLASVLQQGIDNGEFSTELNPSRFAFKLVAAIEGGTVLCRTMETAKPMLDLIKDLKTELNRFSV
jgi:TetR/AcrR family transcriptional repressor of nem operon